MAVGYLSRRAVVLAKTETTEGQDVGPGATDALLTTLPEVAPESEVLVRDIVRDSMSPAGTVIGNKTIRVTFSTEVRGRGSAPTNAAPLRDDVLFRAAGLSPSYSPSAGSVIYRPVSSWASVNTCSMWVYLGGAVYVKIQGCRANLEVNVQSGQYGRFNWTVTGVFGAVSTNVLDGSTTPTYDQLSVTPEPAKGGTVVFGGLAAGSTVVQGFTLNLNNEINPRPDISAASGIKSYMLTARNPQGTVNPELFLKADYDVWAAWEAGTKIPISVKYGTNPNQWKFSVLGAQLGNMTFGDRASIRTLECPFTATGISTAGDDEIELICGQSI